MDGEEEAALPVIDAHGWEELEDHFVFAEVPAEEPAPVMLWVPLWVEG